MHACLAHHINFAYTVKYIFRLISILDWVMLSYPDSGFCPYPVSYPVSCLDFLYFRNFSNVSASFANFQILLQLDIIQKMIIDEDF